MKPPPDKAQFEEIRSLLSSHPGFRVRAVEHNPGANQSALRFGRVLRHLRLIGAGAEFEKAALRFCGTGSGPHRAQSSSSCSGTFPLSRRALGCFYTSSTNRGEICFQGDYPIGRAAPKPFRVSLVAEENRDSCRHTAGLLHLRVGVWLPVDGRHSR